MRRQDVYEFRDGRSKQEGAGIGPRPRTHLPELLQPTLGLRIGSGQFRLDAGYRPAVKRILLVERDLLIRAALAALVTTCGVDPLFQV